MLPKVDHTQAKSSTTNSPNSGQNIQPTDIRHQNQSTEENTNSGQSNNFFQLQLINAIACLGLTLFALAVLTCPPVASVIGIATALTKTVSTVSTVGTIACLLAVSGLYAYRCSNSPNDGAETLTATQQSSL
ncbi:MAG: hypothetical protein WCR08_08085 [Gammaproteobacteria bacterium]